MLHRKPASTSTLLSKAGPLLSGRTDNDDDNHNGSFRRFPPGRRAFVCVLVLALAVTTAWSLVSSNKVLDAMLRLDNFGVKDILPIVKTIDNHDAPLRNKYRPISCPGVLARSKHDDFYDPNKGLLESSPKRLTITTPPFWISLHTEWFDKMRWVSIMKKGTYYETGLTTVFQEILDSNTTTLSLAEQATARPHGLVLDVGMNIGWFTLWSRKLGHSVVAFEPNPVMHVRMCESLNLNHWDNHETTSNDENNDNGAGAPFVKIYPYGVAHVEGVMNLTTGHNPGASSFYEERLAKRFRKAIPVQVVTLDNVAQQEGWLLNQTDEKDDDGGDGGRPTIHLMKIDVEGYENFVVLGATRLLQSGIVSNIILENSIADDAQVVSFLDLLYRSGYQVHALLSVNGDPIRLANFKMDDVNSEISLIPSRDEAFAYDDSKAAPSVHYLIHHTLNMWWTRR